MFTFNTVGGDEMKVRFHHTGRRKKRSPKATVCRVFNGADNVVLEAVAKPVSEVPVIFSGPDAKEKAIRELGKKAKKFLRTEDGSIVAMLRGDNFCYARGRRESLKKAIADLSRRDRARAWDAYFDRFSK